MLMIAMNLCYIHVSPLNRRHTTTQTSTHLIVLARCDGWLFSRCDHHYFLRYAKNTLPHRRLSNDLLLLQHRSFSHKKAHKAQKILPAATPVSGRTNNRAVYKMSLLVSVS